MDVCFVNCCNMTFTAGNLFPSHSCIGGTQIKPLPEFEPGSLAWEMGDLPTELSQVKPLPGFEPGSPAWEMGDLPTELSHVKLLTGFEPGSPAWEVGDLPTELFLPPNTCMLIYIHNIKMLRVGLKIFFYYLAVKCGDKPDQTPFIVGGRDSEPGAWPWQLSLQYQREDGTWGHTCGAVLVDPYWALTAAHCTNGWGKYLE